ncbi:MAG: hypothetical protein ACOYIA_07790 [Eubacteriales bacterium]|jgi:hypothetical protein
MDEKNDKKEIYIGETGPDGLPRGRGTIDFGDGRRYSGMIDGASQTGRGVYYYPDGSRLFGGFTINAGHPAWRFVYPDGREVAGFVSRFLADDEEVRRGEFNEIDSICAEITKAAEKLGLSVEYNARTILADALWRRGEQDAEAAVRAAASGCTGMLTVPYVIRYIYG